jgi:hypothetical protein
MSYCQCSFCQGRFVVTPEPVPVYGWTASSHETRFCSQEAHAQLDEMAQRLDVLEKTTRAQLAIVAQRLDLEQERWATVIFKPRQD